MATEKKLTTVPTAFIGGNVPQTIYDKLAKDAVQCKRSISKQLEFILEQYFKEKQNGR